MSSLRTEYRHNVAVVFQVFGEIHDRALFQKDGHFVCGMKDREKWPNERPWKGDLVYVLELHLQDEHGNKLRQLLRVMGDSPEVAQEEMIDRIKSAVAETAIFTQVKEAHQNNFARVEKDFEVLKLKYDALHGEGSAAQAIVEARVREAVGG